MPSVSTLIPRYRCRSSRCAHRRAAGLVGIPRPAPGRRAGFQRGDDPVGDFLIVVPWRTVNFAAAVLRSRCGACPVHRGVLPSWVSGTPSAPHPDDRGKGALARGRRPVLAAGNRRCGRRFHFIFVVLIVSPLLPACTQSMSRAGADVSRRYNVGASARSARSSRSAHQARPNSRATRDHFDQRRPKTAVAEHIAMTPTFATDFCDAENGGIPSGPALSRNS